MIDLYNFFGHLIGLCFTGFFKNKRASVPAHQFWEKRKIFSHNTSREPYRISLKRGRHYKKRKAQEDFSETGWVWVFQKTFLKHLIYKTELKDSTKCEDHTGSYTQEKSMTTLLFFLMIRFLKGFSYHSRCY